MLLQILSGKTGSAADAIHLLTFDKGWPGSHVTGQPSPLSVGSNGVQPSGLCFDAHTTLLHAVWNSNATRETRFDLC
jgi:hypothetical protein